MAKSLLEIRCAGRRVKFNIKDIHKVFRVHKKDLPKIPDFEVKVQHMPETDEEA